MRNDPREIAFVVPTVVGLTARTAVIAALTLILSASLAAIPRAAHADIGLLDGPKVKAKLAVPLRARPFDLRDVRLLDGPFLRAMELDKAYLLALEPDRLLHTFRLNAGLPSTAQPLGGWEEPGSEVRGHTLGHYLSALALMHASTGDESLRERAERIVAALADCQEALKSGYLSAYPESFIDRVERLQRVWAPYYTLHKILAGLLDVHVHCEDRKALEVAKRFADWVIARNDRLSDEEMQNMLGNEHGGMNEVLANLHALTGEERYLKISRRFNHRDVIGPASERVDRLTGLHANTQIPKFVGTARQYELTGDESLRTASEFFWNTVVYERSYAIGGHSDGEAFSPKERLSEAFGPSTTETCNTYNMLKLTRHIFAWEPRASVADYYERALLNHILCSQDPSSGMVCYYVPLRSGSRKTYSTPNDSFWCCVGTGIENHAKYGDSIYFHDGADTLFVNLFIASELRWKAKGLTLRQETRFPDVADGRARVRLVLEPEAPVDLTLNVRWPFWATSGFAVRVNGEGQGQDQGQGGEQKSEGGPSSYVSLTRTWKRGDAVEIDLPFSLRTEGFRDNPRRFAFLDGPLVLAAEIDPSKPIPAILADDPLAALKPLPGVPSTFIGSPAAFRRPGGPGVAVKLEPFFKVHGGRHYVVYWDQLTPEEMEARERARREEAERRRALDERTVDRVVPHDRESEEAHALKGEGTGSGEFRDRSWRHAVDGGWFSYELKVLADAAQELLVTYWGSDGGGRVFDILVDGETVATQRLEGNRPDAFHDETYPLPAGLLREEGTGKAKEKVVVRFQAHPGATAGGAFDVRVLRKGGKVGDGEKPEK